MKKFSLLFVLLIAGMLFPTSTNAQEIEIQVSPHVLNLQSNSVVVTIHTNISFWSVSASSVVLNGIKIHSWKADDRGFFVAKFESDEVKDLDLAIGDYNTLTLQGQTKSGATFYGSEDILILNNISKRKK